MLGFLGGVKVACAMVAQSAGVMTVAQSGGGVMEKFILRGRGSPFFLFTVAQSVGMTVAQSGGVVEKCILRGRGFFCFFFCCFSFCCFSFYFSFVCCFSFFSVCCFSFYFFSSVWTRTGAIGIMARSAEAVGVHVVQPLASAAVVVPRRRLGCHGSPWEHHWGPWVHH